MKKIIFTCHDCFKNIDREFSVEINKKSIIKFNSDLLFESTNDFSGEDYIDQLLYSRSSRKYEKAINKYSESKFKIDSTPTLMLFRTMITMMDKLRACFSLKKVPNEYYETYIFNSILRDYTKDYGIQPCDYFIDKKYQKKYKKEQKELYDNSMFMKICIIDGKKKIINYFVPYNYPIGRKFKLPLTLFVLDQIREERNYKIRQREDI